MEKNPIEEPAWIKPIPELDRYQAAIRMIEDRAVDYRKRILKEVAKEEVRKECLEEVEDFETARTVEIKLAMDPNFGVLGVDEEDLGKEGIDWARVPEFGYPSWDLEAPPIKTGWYKLPFDLIEIYSHPTSSSSQKRFAARNARYFQFGQVENIIRELLKDKDKSVKGLAVDVLATTGDYRMKLTLLKEIANGEDLFLRVCAPEALFDLRRNFEADEGEPEEEKNLLRAQYEEIGKTIKEDESVLVRIAALEALSTQDENDRLFLESLLDDPQPLIRILAARKIEGKTLEEEEAFKKAEEEINELLEHHRRKRGAIQN